MGVHRMSARCMIVHNDGSLPAAWGHAAPMIEKGLEYAKGEITIDDIYEDLHDNVGKLFLVVDEMDVIAAFIMEIRNFRRKKVCFVPYIGGERLDEWCDEMLKLAEDVARAEGASAVYGMGRRGWARRLKSSGYEELYTTVGKEL